jgi:hypothetical protein
MAKRQPPAPLNIPWTCKPVDSARSSVDILDDGRVYCWIEHELIRGVTPKMLVWWFKNVDGDMIYKAAGCRGTACGTRAIMCRSNPLAATRTARPVLAA